MATSTERIRSFVALPCPPELRASIARVLETWKSSGGVRWVDASASHLTLKFLGNATANQLKSLDERLTAVATNAEPVEFRAGETGAFPSWKRPRVLWLGLVGAEPIVTLAEAVEMAARKAGFEHDSRSFSPHLTLGRVKRTREALEVTVAVRDWKPSVDGELVSEMVLYRSELSSSGARHTPIARYGLSGS